MWGSQIKPNELKGSKLLILILCIFLTFQNTFADAKDCTVDNVDKLYSIIYAPLVPFTPPAEATDDDGNVTLSEDELFTLKRRHFYDQIKGQETIKIDLQTYSTLTKELPGILENFETNLKVLLPDCQPITLFRGVPLGKVRADFETIIETTEIGLNAGLDPITEFARTSMQPNNMSFSQLINLLQNDLSVTTEVITSLLPPAVTDRYFPDGAIPTGNLSEAAVVTYVSLGGLLADPPARIFFLVPRSYAGITENYSSIIIEESGRITNTVALNTNLVAQMLNRLNIQASIITISEIITEKNGTCKIDNAGRWQQLIGGRKARNCPFFTLTQQMLYNKTYRQTTDYAEQNMVYKSLDAILSAAAIKAPASDG